ncbi:hypothetical protein OCH239_00430 [Roseivivax halodurans JCM 10272]|uniref:Glycosyltransferase 2-like domain-containing protein n=1 Tax=Roseivivax halodurans JCM 10272 TaxID=1449350 RepID=X7ENG0_9RHOB|nr:glycosyltransferase [Roseivivax halodurans]ETX16708.1 hypothetical protein OCH239_00430 [Roseivivax halodurans JCM 10272]
MTHITVAVPACNEAEGLPAHLAALDRAAARTRAQVDVLIFANGCTDDTARLASGFKARHCRVRVESATLAPGEANAGTARRLAARMAVALSPETDILVTTDADSQLAPDCLEAFRSGVSAGADLVCGTISFSLAPEVRNAPCMRRHDRIATPYGELMRELRFGIDLLCGRRAPGPLPHYVASGACMALSRALYEAIGGFPDAACGEDRALARCAGRRGARIDYCSRAHAVVSPRLVGRAAGGMADTLRRRLGDPDPLTDAAFLRAADVRRVWQAARSGDRTACLPDAERPMRLSDLERELPRLRAFMDARVRPLVTGTAATAPLVA